MIGEIVVNKPKEKQEAGALYFASKNSTPKNLPEFAQKKLKKLEFKGKLYETVLAEEGTSLCIVVGLGENKKRSVFKNAIAHSVRFAKKAKIPALSLDLDRYLSAADVQNFGKDIAVGFYLGNYDFIKYKTNKKKEKTTGVRSLYISINKKHKSGFEKGLEIGEKVSSGIYLTRDLVNDPASHLSVESMVHHAKLIEKESKGSVDATILDQKECEKLGMGAYLGVAHGSEREPKFIVLHYKPARQKSKNRICLIGKTVIFDSGGLSLKPSDAMTDMKMDMAGGATVLGVFSVLSSLKEKPAVEVFGILPACENMVSGRAMRPGDIVHALNKKTIEVLNTDAEGRLTLADALVYAEKHLKANHIIDIATLTGACMVALGTEIAGLFGNDKVFLKKFRSISEDEGDKCWPLPIYKPYLKKMKSEIADLKNISSERYGGAITAALFLGEFVSKAKWLHIDIAGPAFRHDEPRGTLGRGGTGWGIESLIALLKEYGS